MTFGLAFGIWDYEEILAWPAHIFKHWQARFLMEPWDVQNRMAIAKCKIEPPTWVKGMIRDQEKIEGLRRQRR